METKVCRKCNVEKTLDQYSMWSGRKSHRPDCKSCVAEKQRNYLKDNPEIYERVKGRETKKYWEKRNNELPTLIESIGKIKYCTTCGVQGTIDEFEKDTSTKNAISKIRLRGTCKTCANIRDNEWIKNNPDKMKSYHKKTYNRRKKDENFMFVKKQQDKVYNQKPEVKEKRRESDRIYHRSQKGVWRRLLANALTQLKTTRPKQTRTLTLLGYTHETLFNIVGNKPEGDYHLDHTIPLSWMDNDTPPSIACHLNNLSWITGEHNLSKGNRYANPVTIEYFNLLREYIQPKFINRFTVIDGMVHDNKKTFVLEQWSKNDSCNV